MTAADLPPTLSVCINTRNRSSFLPETLDSMLCQIRPGVEIVVVDGASTDTTQELVQDYARRHASIRYFRSETPIGIDEGYDLAVGHAKGAYCWLMTDDDLIDIGAIDRILHEISNHYDLILLDLNCYTKDMSLSLHHKLYNVSEDKIFDSGLREDFLHSAKTGISYIGSVVLKRSLWFETERRPYYGSYFAHVAVILQSPSLAKILLISHPYIKYRSGNSSWTARSFEIWNFKYPDLVWGLPALPDREKALVSVRHPWKRFLSIVKSRALGEYDIGVFNQQLAGRIDGLHYPIYFLIAIAPQFFLNYSLLIFCLIFRKRVSYTIYNFLLASPYQSFSIWTSALFGLKFPRHAF